MSDPYQIVDFIDFCKKELDIDFDGFGDFERWAVDEFRLFWRCFLTWSKIGWRGASEPICVGDMCETAVFFPEVRLNYADAVLAGGDANSTAIIAARRGRPDEIITRRDLRHRVMRLAAHFERLGVRPRDRVAAVARNRPEAVIAALAAAAVGATFSSCSQDMGVEAVLARFGDLGAVVLLAHAAPEPWDAGEPVADRAREIARRLPGLRHVVLLDAAAGFDIGIPVSSYEEVVGRAAPEADAREIPHFGFNHPLFIMFSSGTTGKPKCIVHGAGGTLLEHLKEHRLHCDLRAGDRLYFHTSCAWMMWNWQLTALASGAEIVLFDGPIEGPGTLWDLVERLGVTVFGTSPTYLQLCERTHYRPRDAHPLTALRSVLSTGSILYDRQFDWFAQNVGPIPLQSISGGTDILGCFVLGLPLRPVQRGEAQCVSLAMDVRAIAEREGDAIGELVCANPFPSRPLGLFGDDGSLFHRTYFSQNPPYWTHGDLIELTASGGARMHGRSDDVMNIKGIRIGPAEIYAILKRVDGVAEAMAIERRNEAEGDSDLVLLVVLDQGRELDADLRRTIRQTLAEQGSTALVPALCIQVPELPETISGKRSETSVRDLVNGCPVRNAGALKNPACLSIIAERIAEASLPRIPERRTGGAAGSTTAEQIRHLLSDTLRLDIGADDSLLDAGADSLAIVQILLRLQDEYGTSLSIDDLLAVPTASGIARRVEDGSVSALEDRPAAAVQGEATLIRPATMDDLDEICALLDRGFANENVSESDWRRIATTRWTDRDPGYGYVLVAGARIVGFLGTLYSDHAGDDGTTRTICNLTSWYVEPAYRSVGMLLVSSVVRKGEAIFTSLTPAPGVERILTGIGFQPHAHLDFFAPRLNPRTILAPRIRVSSDPEFVREKIGRRQQNVFDKSQYDGLTHWYISDKYGDSYLITKKREMKWKGLPIPVSEVLYTDNVELLSRSFDDIVNHISLKQRSILFSIENKYAPLGSHPLRRSTRERYIYGNPDWESGLYCVFSELSILNI